MHEFFSLLGYYLKVGSKGTAETSVQNHFTPSTNPENCQKFPQTKFMPFQNFSRRVRKIAKSDY